MSYQVPKFFSRFFTFTSRNSSLSPIYNMGASANNSTPTLNNTTTSDDRDGDRFEITPNFTPILQEEAPKTPKQSTFSFLRFFNRFKHPHRVHDYPVRYYSTGLPNRTQSTGSFDDDSDEKQPEEFKKPKSIIVHDPITDEPRVQYRQDLTSGERLKEMRRRLESDFDGVEERVRGFEADRPNCEGILDGMNQLYTKVIPTSNLSAKKIDELAARYYGNGAGKKEKILWIVIGPPGSGKSSRAVVPLQKYHDALVLDSDHIKPLIPNFHKGYGCNAVHGDSMKVVFKALYEKALENGDNIVYPTTGGDEERMRTFIQQAKEKGYKVGLSLVDIETKEARQRVLNRSCEKDKDGNVQIVTTDYVDSVGKKPARVYEALKDSVDYAFSADTTGLRKQDPLNITDCSDSTIDILRAMYKK